MPTQEVFIDISSAIKHVWPEVLLMFRKLYGDRIDRFSPAKSFTEGVDGMLMVKSGRRSSVSNKRSLEYI